MLILLDILLPTWLASGLSLVSLSCLWPWLVCFLCMTQASLTMLWSSPYWLLVFRPWHLLLTTLPVLPTLMWSTYCTRLSWSACCTFLLLYAASMIQCLFPDQLPSSSGAYLQSDHRYSTYFLGTVANSASLGSVFPVTTLRDAKLLAERRALSLFRLQDQVHDIVLNTNGLKMFTISHWF